MNDERCPWPFDPILIDIELITQNDRQQTADSRYRNHEPQFRVQITQVLKESRKEQKAAANTSISHTKIRTSLD